MRDISPQYNPYLRIVVQYGSITAGIPILLTIILYFIGKLTWYGSSLGITLAYLFGMMVVLLIGGIQVKRTAPGQYLTFGRMFYYLLLAAIFSSLVLSIYNLLLTNVLIPDFYIQVYQSAIDNFNEELKNIDNPEDMIAVKGAILEYQKQIETWKDNPINPGDIIWNQMKQGALFGVFFAFTNSFILRAYNPQGQPQQ